MPVVCARLHEVAAVTRFGVIAPHPSLRKQGYGQGRPDGRSGADRYAGPVIDSRTASDRAPRDADDDSPEGRSVILGSLVDESRRVLVALLQGPFLDGRKDHARYAQLLRDRAAIEARLADLFLELVVDDDAQVAFVRQSEEDADAPKLLRRLTGLNRLDSVLLLVLRQMLLTQSSRGQRAVVSEQEITQALAAYRRTTSTDEAGFAKEIRASIAKIQRAGLLDEQGGSYEVSPVLRLMVSPDVAREFTRLYKEAGVDVSGTNGGEEGAGVGLR